jgi:hypothetical protein
MRVGGLMQKSVFIVLGALLFSVPGGAYAQECRTRVADSASPELQRAADALRMAIDNYFSDERRISEVVAFYQASAPNPLPSCAGMSETWGSVFMPFLREGHSRGISRGSLVTNSRMPFPLGGDGASPGGRMVEMINYLSIMANTYPPGDGWALDATARCTYPGVAARGGVGGDRVPVSSTFMPDGPSGTVSRILNAMVSRLPRGGGRGRRALPNLRAAVQNYLRLVARVSDTCMPAPVRATPPSSGETVSTGPAATVPSAALAAAPYADVLNRVVAGTATPDPSRSIRIAVTPDADDSSGAGAADE